MPSYRFAGQYPRALFGLRVGINATLTPADGRAQAPIGSTLVAFPGDVVTTDEPYGHSELEADDAAPAPAPAEAPAVAPLPAAQPAPAPVTPVAVADASTAPQTAEAGDPTLSTAK
jgi:2-oxoglutarate dehydrogenase E2 component (dihydrolipoamide succinyltransferase)